MDDIRLTKVQAFAAVVVAIAMIIGTGIAASEFATKTLDERDVRIEKRIASLEKQITGRFDNAEEQITRRFDNAEKQSDNQIQNVNTRIDDLRTHFDERFDDLINTLSK